MALMLEKNAMYEAQYSFFFTTLPSWGGSYVAATECINFHAHGPQNSVADDIFIPTGAPVGLPHLMSVFDQ
jgi:hypothetical protein